MYVLKNTDPASSELDSFDTDHRDTGSVQTSCPEIQSEVVSVKFVSSHRMLKCVNNTSSVPNTYLILSYLKILN